jgi:hypothetical protein
LSLFNDKYGLKSLQLLEAEPSFVCLVKRLPNPAATDKVKEPHTPHLLLNRTISYQQSSTTMQKGSGKFSFSRMISNAFPVFANDDPNDVDMSPRQADDLVGYQLGLPFPRYLTEASFFVAHVTDNKTFSQKVHKNLLKASIISAPSPDNSLPPVTTAAIGKNFANQLSHISIHAQRKVIGMLFFWEEECTRWMLLDQEEAEIRKAIAEGNVESNDLDLALQAVEMKKKLLPSQRAEATTNVGEGVGFNLPAYN